MKKLHLAACSCLLITLALGSIGCGSGGDSGPLQTGVVSATKNALVAEYDVRVIHSGTSAWVEFGPDTNYGRQTSVSAATVGLFQTIPILVAGMKPSTTYHMRAHATWNGGSWVDQDRTFTTASLSSVGLTAPQIKITRPNANLNPAPGVELIDGLLLGPPNQSLLTTLVTDLQGNVIWYYPASAVEGYKLMPNGYFIADLGSVLREFDLAGNTIQAVNESQVNQSLQVHGYTFQITGFHHDLLLLPNGHWIGLANVLKAFTDLPGFPGVTNVLGDVLVDVDPTGNVVWAWSVFDHLDINRHPWGLVPFSGAGGATGGDWTHGNALQYTADGNLLFSMRAQSWIIKIDYENGAGSGDILWRLGYQGDFAILGGDPRDWFYGQHDPVIVSTNGPQMTLSIWDNGNNRIQPDGSKCGPVVPCYSRPTIFQIDESTKIADLVWQDLPNLFSFWGGAIESLSNGNVEFDLTDPFVVSSSRVEEVSETDNPQTVWQLDLTGENAYRAYRIPSLYPGVTWKQ
ncbi:MAG: aryl-sulfate sulfotransferase [Terriglobales bacterium]